MNQESSQEADLPESNPLGSFAEPNHAEYAEFSEKGSQNADGGIWSPSHRSIEATADYDASNRRTAEIGAETDQGLLASEALPMNWLAPQYIQAETLVSLITSGILAGIGLIGLIVLWFAQGFGGIWYWAAFGYLCAVVVLVSSSFLWPRISYRHSLWRFTERSLEIHRGVLWKHRIAIPLGRVQHADVAQGPLMRQFNLGKLVIHTAGTANSTIELNGLSYETAVALRDELVQQTESKSVT